MGRNLERHFEAMRLRDSGLKWREVAQRLGVSYERARQMYSQARREQGREPHWTDGLSTRARNALLSYGFESRESVAARSRELHLIGGIGKRSAREILRWLKGAAGIADNMCPNCVTPWKCNGPHIPSGAERRLDAHQQAALGADATRRADTGEIKRGAGAA